MTKEEMERELAAIRAEINAWVDFLARLIGEGGEELVEIVKDYQSIQDDWSFAELTSSKERLMERIIAFRERLVYLNERVDGVERLQAAIERVAAEIVGEEAER